MRLEEVVVVRVLIWRLRGKMMRRGRIMRRKCRKLFF